MPRLDRFAPICFVPRESRSTIRSLRAPFWARLSSPGHDKRSKANMRQADWNQSARDRKNHGRSSNKMWEIVNPPTFSAPVAPMSATVLSSDRVRKKARERRSCVRKTAFGEKKRSSAAHLNCPSGRCSVENSSYNRTSALQQLK